MKHFISFSRLQGAYGLQHAEVSETAPIFKNVNKKQVIYAHSLTLPYRRIFMDMLGSCYILCIGAGILSIFFSLRKIEKRDIKVNLSFPVRMK